MANELASVNNGLALAPKAEDVKELIEGIQSVGSDIQFGTVKVAAGGTPVFEVTELGADESDAVKSIDAVILLARKNNTLWPEGSEPNSGDRPVCRSTDGVNGYGEEGGCYKCASCPKNQFGSGKNGGKACKNSVMLYILRPAGEDKEADLLPLQMKLPASSIRAFNNYQVFLLSKGCKLASVLTRMSVTKAQNKSGTVYGEVTFKMLNKLTREDAASLNDYAETLKTVFAAQSIAAQGFTEVVGESSEDEDGLPPF